MWLQHAILELEKLAYLELLSAWQLRTFHAFSVYSKQIILILSDGDSVNTVPNSLVVSHLQAALLANLVWQKHR